MFTVPTLGHDRPPGGLPGGGADEPSLSKVFLVLELVDDPLGLGTVHTVDGDVPTPLGHAGLERPDVLPLAAEFEVPPRPPGDAPQGRVSDAGDRGHRPGVADAVVVEVALDGADDAVHAGGLDEARMAVTGNDRDVATAGRPIEAAGSLEGPPEVGDPGKTVLGPRDGARHRPMAGAVVEAGVEAGLAEGDGGPRDAALPVPAGDGVAVAARRMLPDAEERDHRCDEGIRAGPRPGGLATLARRRATPGCTG